jgi:hypothetical protein
MNRRLLFSVAAVGAIAGGVAFGLSRDPGPDTVLTAAAAGSSTPTSVVATTTTTEPTTTTSSTTTTTVEPAPAFPSTEGREDEDPLFLDTTLPPTIDLGAAEVVHPALDMGNGQLSWMYSIYDRDVAGVVRDLTAVFSSNGWSHTTATHGAKTELVVTSPEWAGSVFIGPPPPVDPQTRVDVQILLGAA